ncbi:MAG: FAD:protein FMN transferase [Sulfuricella sp.]|nr:FAD:protein FMN transferase [Sulfuricella sp.]
MPKLTAWWRACAHPTHHPFPITLFLLFLLAGCTKEPPVYQQQSYVFGTLVDVTIAGEDEKRAQQLIGQVLQEFDRLHHALHAWKPSDLSRLNQAIARGEKYPVTPELAEMLRDAAALSAQSGGTFNPTIGGLIKLWGFQNDEFLPLRPDPAAIAALVKAAPGMSDLTVENGTVTSRNPALQLDLGGYAKGYALDRAAAYLRGQGVKGALINIGGNILAIGTRHGQAWRVGIQHPRQPAALATLELRDGEAIGTSGDYQRFFELDGQRYCHIIDPRSGYPVQGVEAVTVLIPPGRQAGTLSDVVSKPLFIAGVDGWRAAASRMGITQALLVDVQGEIHLTAALKSRLHFLAKAPLLHETP